MSESVLAGTQAPPVTREMQVHPAIREAPETLAALATPAITALVVLAVRVEMVELRATLERRVVPVTPETTVQAALVAQLEVTPGTVAAAELVASHRDRRELGEIRGAPRGTIEMSAAA